MTVQPSMKRYVRAEGVEEAAFSGFDRPPYLANFRLRGTSFSIQLVNVHLYFGSDGQEDRNRRALEVAALARWADLRFKSVYSGARELVVLGDFNMPKPRRDGSNVVRDALESRGLRTPEHSTIIGSSIASDNQYDQVALLPSASGGLDLQMGVFDFDAVVFRKLWERGAPKAYNSYVRYYLSDHRVMWVALLPGF